MNFKEMQEKAGGVATKPVAVERTWTPDTPTSSRPVYEVRDTRPGHKSLKQDFSEADSDVNPADLFPELYKIFNSKIEELAQYVGLAESPFDFLDEVQRYKLFGNLSYAMRRSSELLSWCFVQQKMAYARRRQMEAISALDDFPQYIVDQSDLGNTIKATDATRESFVKKSEKVINAHLREGFCDAMTEQALTLKMEFSESSKTLRSMVYGQKDSNNLSSLNGTGT